MGIGKLTFNKYEFCDKTTMKRLFIYKLSRKKTNFVQYKKVATKNLGHGHETDIILLY